ncbi:response regulator [Bradyrhizobium sp. Pha-3]|uniref:response regulator n=1 Tax=Bradyrhizobium sp. Pha-3 TaxID=208375 RepID=UPI0035D3FD73
MLAEPAHPADFWGIALQDVPIILVIEDDRDLQMMVEDALRDGGYEPAIAGSGEEALTLLKAFRTKYSALVTDIRLLGRLDGWRVARGAREIDPSFPVLYITGGGGDEWPTRGVPDSVLLNKPFSPDELVAAVAKLLKNGAPA